MSHMDADNLTRKVVAEELVKKHERFLASERAELAEKEREEAELAKLVEGAKKIRDGLNEKVANLKGKRTKLHEETKVLKEGFFDLLDKEGELRKATSGIGELRKRIDALDWDIITKAITLDAERTLIDEIKQVYSKINEKSSAVEQKADVKKRIKELSYMIGAKFSEAQGAHEELVKLAAESQMHHELFVENVKKHDEVRERVRTLKRMIINHEAGREFWLGKVQEHTVSLSKSDDKTKEANEKKEVPPSSEEAHKDGKGGGE